MHRPVCELAGGVKQGMSGFTYSGQVMPFPDALGGLQLGREEATWVARKSGLGRGSCKYKGPEAGL